MLQQFDEFTHDATKIIAEKFQSSNADEVLLALNVNIYTFLKKIVITTIRMINC